MKLRFEVNSRDVVLFKKIIANLKKVSQGGDIYITIDNDQVIFHNYYNFDATQGLLYFFKLYSAMVFASFMVESKRPDNQIILKLKDEINKFNNAVSTIPDNKTPFFFLSKEEEKRFLKLKHEIQSGISSVESKTEIDIVSEAQPVFPNFENKKLELLVPLKSFLPFLEEGHSLESPIILKIFGIGESTASVSLKIRSCGFKVHFSRLMIIQRSEDVNSQFAYTHMLSPRVLKPLASACALAELGCLTLFEDNVLAIAIQHMGTEEDINFKAQELMIIPELAVQEE